MKIFMKIDSFKVIVEDNGVYVAHINWNCGYGNLYVGNGFIPINGKGVIRSLVNFLQSDLSIFDCGDSDCLVTLRKSFRGDGSLYIETNGCLKKRHKDDLPFNLLISLYELPFVISLLESCSDKIEKYLENLEEKCY